MRAYTCRACGAELMTEETTTATECPYCGSPTVLPERIEGGVKPEPQAGWKCACGTVVTGKFCPECGDPFDENDVK